MSSKNSTFRFLLVDDSRAIQSIIRRAIESCGYEDVDIRIAGDGEIAMEILNEFKPDLIITDWHMPKMSGLEFCQQVRQVHGSDMLIGFVTTEANQDKINQAHQSGASFVINKPFTDEEFCKTVLKLLPKERPVQQNDADSIIDFEKCKQIIDKFFVKRPYQLSPAKPVTLEDLTDSNLIGLYGFNRSAHPVAGIAIMDMRAVAILWGATENKSSETISSLLSSSEFKDEHILKARELMEDIGPIVKMPAGKDKVGLTRSSILSRSFPRLAVVLKENAGRADFKLEVPNIGEGIITFILVQQWNI